MVIQFTFLVEELSDDQINEIYDVISRFGGYDIENEPVEEEPTKYVGGGPKKPKS
jgi:hypothetical protein